MTSIRPSTQHPDAAVPEPDVAAIWVERMARRFYRSPDDVRDLVSLTIGRIDPEMAAHECDADYRICALGIMRRIVLDRCFPDGDHR